MAPQGIDELIRHIEKASGRLHPEVRWRIELALDVIGCRPKGPNPLPLGTWRDVVVGLIPNLDTLERAEITGSRIVGATLLAVEAAGHLAHARRDEAGLAVAQAWQVLFDLTLDDVIGDPWERVLGRQRAQTGGPDPLVELVGQPA